MVAATAKLQMTTDGAFFSRPHSHPPSCTHANLSSPPPPSSSSPLRPQSCPTSPRAPRPPAQQQQQQQQQQQLQSRPGSSSGCSRGTQLQPSLLDDMHSLTWGSPLASTPAPSPLARATPSTASRMFAPPASPPPSPLLHRGPLLAMLRGHSPADLAAATATHLQPLSPRGGQQGRAVAPQRQAGSEAKSGGGASPGESGRVTLTPTAAASPSSSSHTPSLPHSPTGASGSWWWW